jgi:hypothetical protein
MSEPNPEKLIHTRLLTRGVHIREPASLRWRKRYCLIGLLLLCAVDGGIFPFLREGSEIDRLSMIPLGLLGIGLTLLWCEFDSAERGNTLKLPIRICIVFLAAVGVPVYLLITRRWWGIVSIILMTIFVAACVLVAGLAAAVTCLVLGMPFPT